MLKNQSYNLHNYKNENYNKCINCNCDLCNEEEILKPFIENYLANEDLNENIHDNKDIQYKKINIKRKKGFYCSGCNNYIKNVHHQKNNSMNFKNSKYNNYKNNLNNDNEMYFHTKIINNTYDGNNDHNRNDYNFCCSRCEQ